jgi:type VI secretion system protein ImpM
MFQDSRHSDAYLGLPGWYGKLPGMGDFANRRVSHEFLEPWDQWLQFGLSYLKTNHPNWLQNYLRAPIWYFALGKHVLSPQGWVGIMLPSVDAVGRYFPLTLANPIDSFELHGHEARMKLAQWWSQCARYASMALEQDLDATSFDNQLIAAFRTGLVGAINAPLIHDFPSPGRSNWYAHRGDQGIAAHAFLGLPATDGVESLFDCVPLPVSTDNLETLPAALMDGGSLR